MHMSLMKSIASVSSKRVSKEVLQSFPNICWCWFLCSTDLAELEIPIDYDELDKILKVARIILQIKKLLNKTILGYKIS
ncbi:uncharacterized protein OCT59_006192 [Rhizophagus irregularis]|uniref:Uncharacterized protein n=1 Tax=Rhizophagus irregularis TaxID=588596 RepID=A0A915ZXQ5_9GLOM|nr:hypothetical protein OCT59_006192 [Rhizophagus irregularis]GBC38511.1 hypothetical protein RIR_jg4856.t1 [Rhizophagus irregularis DAOM 181602=DAOM 197198]CAB5391106.1 unnamed protein product [Rhizophagus irregularis]